MVKWGLNGRPISEDNSSNRSSNIPPKHKNKSHKRQKIKRTPHIKIINRGDLIDKNMEINVLARLLDTENKPIINAEIDVIDNNRFIRTLKTSSDGYFAFYGGYIGRYHSFVFSFKGNKKFNPCKKSLIIA